MSILIVDDSQDDTQLLTAMLEGAGYREILTADSADSAYKILGVKDPSQNIPKIDLILLDVLMPATNGIQVCRRLKSIERLRDIPVIIVTVQSD
ncbi:MAG TPA: response regulator, partial [Nitrospiraceae bacterium]|nr:response regulator [Nitrospiraceae bacterium]